MLVALSDSVAVAAIAAVAGIITTVISLFNRREVRRTNEKVDDLSTTNVADHGMVARALSALIETVTEHNRRNGERFERLGQRMGEVAIRQEKTNERIDRVNERIDDVIATQRDHLQHHFDTDRH